MLAFTYLQVIPEFVDFLLLFGEQQHAQDLYCSGFYQQTRLQGADLGTTAPLRNWSGCDLQVCYSLKSIERSQLQAHWPWSIRHCAVHHSFDAKTVRSTWVIIKGDNLIEERINRATNGKNASLGKPAFETVEKAFAASLTTHLMLCDWSSENWRWYVKFLEEKFEDLTSETITTNADVPVSPQTMTDNKKLQCKTTQGMGQINGLSRVFSFPASFRTPTQDFENRPMTPQSREPVTRVMENPSGKKQQVPPGWKCDTLKSPASPPGRRDTYGQRIFSFEDLQDIQHIEEKGNEILLILRSNLNVILQLSQYYTSITESDELPGGISRSCIRNMVHFSRRIHGIVKTNELQILRVEALICLLADRKRLVSSCY